MGFEKEKQLDADYIMNTYARKSVDLVSGRGMCVCDDAGKEYLDFISGVGVDSLGHCHPEVVKALTAQADRLIHVSNYYYIEGRGELAKTVSDLLNTGISELDSKPWKSFFTNSGAESNECAIKLARLWSKRFGHGGIQIVTLDNSFHGRTLATLAATAQPAKQEAFKPLPEGFLHTPINDIAALEALFAEHQGEICAVLLEPVQGESGVHPCTLEFMEAVDRLTRESDALFICDEVQTGIYRCGAYPFAFQHFGITPDIVTIAKGIASGFPMGICAARDLVALAFEPGDHGSTFGGSCLAVAAARATLATIEAENLPSQIVEVGMYLREGLGEIEGVVSVRGLGLMCACDLAGDIDAAQVVARGLSVGLLLNYTGAHTLRFLPPLICTKAEIDALLAKLGGLF
ncbi:MAG: acetylornithine/succinylornithine family transaminase [Raoultibacter sp.]